LPDVLLIKYHWCIICCMANQWKEPVELIIGIVNHEYQVLSYRIDIMIDGIENIDVIEPSQIGDIAELSEVEE